MTVRVDEAEARELLAWLRGRREDMVAFLEDLVLAESPSTDPGAQAAAQALLTDALESVGFRVRHVPGRETGGHLYARPRERERGAPVQLLLGHTDTVWSRGAVERMPVEVDDGVMRGPGVFDMKGGLVEIVFALRALRELGLETPVTPVVFVNSDEEIGSPESTRHVRRLARHASRTLVLEPALGAEGRLKTTRRGTGNFEIRVVGRSAHTGLAPEEGASAIQELAHVIHALHSLTDPERGIGVNVGRIEGGARANVVAADARAVVDVRVETLEDGRGVEERIRALESITPGTRIEVEGGVDRPPMEATPRNRTLWLAAREAGRALGLELEEGMSGGASDGNTTSLYTATLDGLGPVGGGAHATHEHVVVDSLPERAALLALLLRLPELQLQAVPDVASEEGVTTSR